ncbi:hypothetical protein [Pedobacter psychroterrae]|uniref:Uncharacterized protein n=1 Tax=Pedobacter psychroterrae TaxID=2530453 RepID=A0A4R0N8P5_9SPHI|nr:hypothetical protein [Pedobacter psychroterrae]TCC96385.1 hypothetical protein EZ437_21395 [Pedobacter psychroterrae]
MELEICGNKMKRNVIVIALQILFCFVLSCSEGKTVYNHQNNIEDLGDNYYFLGDGRESQILKNLKPSGRSRFGKTIIPAEVLRYNFDEHYIIAETREIAEGRLRYWIIRKNTILDSIQSIDSLSFYSKIDSLGMSLKVR